MTSFQPFLFLQRSSLPSQNRRKIGINCIDSHDAYISKWFINCCEESNFISWAKLSDDKIWIGPDQITDWITDRIKSGCFFAPKPHVVTFKSLCPGLLCSATIDKRKREARMISSVSYFLACFLFICLFVFLMPSHVLLFLLSISFTTREKRGDMRCTIVIDMTAEVHVSDLCSSWKWLNGVLRQKKSRWAYAPLLCHADFILACQSTFLI